MKKTAYVAGGILIGVVLSTAGGAFADQVKSLVGKKVTGEYNIIVNGEKLSDKGAVIDSRANVPARALSEALGADVSVSGKTITITSKAGDSDVSGSDNSTITTSSNKYIGYTKSSLEELRSSTIEKILTPTKAGREDVVKWLAESKEQGNEIAIQNWTKELAQYDADIAKYEADLKLIDQALLTAK
ncbi:stalk domain-containing protein [Paenibacillus xylanexedens]|uniref:stalk domain-containing protein n=1 Tax=Paenibacillus xylanexedens TaxID=528191 RepID=UPI003D08BDEE